MATAKGDKDQRHVKAIRAKPLPEATWRAGRLTEKRAICQGAAFIGMMGFSPTSFPEAIARSSYRRGYLTEKKKISACRRQ